MIGPLDHRWHASPVDENYNPDLEPFYYYGRLSKAASFRSRDRENLIEHVFISEILQECWFVREQPIEVLRSEVDAYGYDLVLECNSVIRHVQLKATEKGGSLKKQSVNRILESKPGGCVVWILFRHLSDVGRIQLSYLYFGGKLPLDHMPTLGDMPAKNPRSKTLRNNIRLLNAKQFDVISTTSELLDRMFGGAQAVRGFQ